MITLNQSINGLIGVIIFKRTMTNISFNITYLQDNYLGTYVSMNKFRDRYTNGSCVDIFMHPVFSFESK